MQHIVAAEEQGRTKRDEAKDSRQPHLTPTFRGSKFAVLIHAHPKPQQPRNKEQASTLIFSAKLLVHHGDHGTILAQIFLPFFARGSGPEPDMAKTAAEGRGGGGGIGHDHSMFQETNHALATAEAFECLHSFGSISQVGLLDGRSPGTYPIRRQGPNSHYSASLSHDDGQLEDSIRCASLCFCSRFANCSWSRCQCLISQVLPPPIRRG